MRVTWRGTLLGLLGTACLIGPLAAQVTERIDIDSNGAQANLGGDLPSPPGSVVSDGGRYVAFVSAAANLVSGDTNGQWDVFVRDRLAGTTERISVDSSGIQGNANSGLYGIAISPDGRFVAFESAASNLVPGDTNGARDIFIRDRLAGVTERVSLTSSGLQGNGSSFHLALSPDGRFVAFESVASDLVSGDTNGLADVFLRDRASGSTERMSVSTGGLQGNGDSLYPSLSADGEVVGFSSLATNLVTSDTNARWDVFIRVRSASATLRVSASSTGSQGNGNSYCPWVSSSGRFVAFTSEATNLGPYEANGGTDVFVHDSQTGATVCASIALNGLTGNHTSNDISLSADGRFAAFWSGATNLVPNSPTGPGTWIFVRDLIAGTTELVSRANDGSIPTAGGCNNPSFSPDGRYIAYRSNMTALVAGDTNNETDVFVHDRLAAGFTSLCHPGLDGVMACPCANPPASAGRGCDNSASSGGAQLSAFGNAYLSIDSLTLATRDERPSATSIVLQGDAPLQGGSTFGQGVRCVGGTMKRLYVKTAANGSITAPELATGDAPISIRSAQLGTQLAPGQPYFYLVYYRDPVVLGGCPASSTFNATQTASIGWWP